MALNFVSTILPILFYIIFVQGTIDVSRGIELDALPFYNPNQDFTCLDQSATIPFSSVNDDYCDCIDGSDEPGTAACPEGKFYCTNAGHVGKYIQSSRVNDGICDCCDGSDEYDSSVVCFNQCMEHGARAAAERKRLLEVANTGFESKLQQIRLGKERKYGRQTRFAVLDDLLEVRRARLEELKNIKESAEAPEKEAKDLHKKQWDDHVAARKEQQERNEMRDAYMSLDFDRNGLLSFVDLMANDYLKENLDENAAKELLGSQDVIDSTEFISVWPKIKEKFVKDGRSSLQEAETPGEADLEPEIGTDEGAINDGVPPVEAPPTETPKSEDSTIGDPVGDYNPHDHDDDDDDDDDDLDDDDTTDDHDNTSTIQDEMPEYGPEVKLLIEAADEARRNFDEVDKDVKDLDEERSDIEKYLAIDFGTEQEFASMIEECFEFTDREYVYKLCPFNKATQKPKNGGTETELGKWGTWGELPMKYSKMVYKDGQGCWNGPSRSTTVSLACGATNEVVSVSEPSRCEYAMVFHTPALCDQVDVNAHTEL